MIERNFAFENDSQIDFILEDSITSRNNPLYANKKSNPCIIEVFENEGDNIPHFHMTNPNKRDIGHNITYIRILENRYFDHNRSKEIMILNSAERKALDEWLSKTNDKDNTKTNYERIIEIWNKGVSNPNFLVPINFKKPDYRNLHL